MKSAVGVGLVLIVLLGVIAAQGPEQEWYKYYEDAKKALEQGEWQAAVDNLQICVTKKPRSKQKTETYSHFYTEYYPHFFLARAYAGLGKYESAEEQIKEEERQREILKDSAYAGRLAELKQQVAAGLAERSRPAAPVDPAAGIRRLVDQGEEQYRLGDYDAARKFLQQAQAEAAGVDPKLAERAADRLRAMDQEEKNWTDAQRFLREGDYAKAIESLNAVIRSGGRHAREAGDLQAQAQQRLAARLAGEQSLQDSLATVRSFAEKGQYAEALGLLQNLAGKPGSEAQIQPVRADLLKRMVRDAGGMLDRDEVGPAETLWRLADKYFPDAPEVRELNQRLQPRKKIVQAEDALREKRWDRAETLLQPLLAVTEVSARARAGLDRVALMRRRLEKELAARQVLAALQADFPDSDQVWPRLQKVQEAERRRGTLDVEEYLRSALGYFYGSGDYRQARFLLSEYLKRKGRHADLALFFRAVAAICLYRLEGDSGKGYLDEARKDVAGISAGFEPPRRWVSGAALRYFDQWRNSR
jgi:hypothetical protein